MTNRESKRRRQRAKITTSPRVHTAQDKYVVGCIAKGAAAHTAWRTANPAQCSLDSWVNNQPYYGDAKHYRSLIHEINVAPVQLWLNERSGQRTTREVRLEDV